MDRADGTKTMVPRAVSLGSPAVAAAEPDVPGAPLDRRYYALRTDVPDVALDPWQQTPSPVAMRIHGHDEHPLMTLRPDQLAPPDLFAAAMQLEKPWTEWQWV